jgi:predicted MPP superfamily phosphohydrolase
MPIFILLTIIVFQALLIFVHLTVYATLAAAFGIHAVWFKWLFIILAVTFTTASIISRWVKGRLMNWFYAFSAYWFGLVHFLFGGAVLFYFILAIFYRNNIYVAPAIVGAICFGAFFLIHLYGTSKSGRGELTNIKISLSKVPGFNKDFWSGKKIVFISDVHLGNVRGRRYMARVVRQIQALQPYAVFIGGDLFDGPACNEAALVEPLRELKVPGGVNYITGNHEYYLPNVQRAIEAIRATGVKILNNEKMDMGGIEFVGVDYMATNKPEKLKEVLEGFHIDRNKPNILLKHEPKDLDIAEAAGMSVGFFGHTHQGQIWPLSLLTKQIYKGFDYGLKPHGTMQVYTSSGIGTWGPPLRLGTRSEIVLVEFL